MPMPRRCQLPDKVKIHWDHTIDGMYNVEFDGSLGRTLNLVLNESNPGLAAFHRDPELLAYKCIALIAHELVQTDCRWRAMPSRP